MNHFYHRRSIRLQGYDYTQCGGYFVTIASYQHQKLFGSFCDDMEMRLNQIGKIILCEWERISVRFPGTQLDTLAIMPDHLHGILFINQFVNDQGKGSSERFGMPVSGSIPTIVRSFKSAVSNRVHRLTGLEDQTVWQRNYFEKIIRSEKHLEVVRKYIQGNHMKHGKS
jgi:putative transposase